MLFWGIDIDTSGWNWDAIAAVAVAIVAIPSLVINVLLMRSTRQAAEAAAGQAQVERAALQAQIRPLVIPLQDDNVAFNLADGFFFAVPIENVGAGLAIDRGVRVLTGDDIEREPNLADRPAHVPSRTRVNYPVNRHVSFRFGPVPEDDAGPLLESFHKCQPFVIEHWYTDVLGEQTTVTRMRVSFHAAQAGWIAEVEAHYHF